MGASRTRRVTVVYLLLLAAAGALALWLSKEFQVARLAATAIVLALAAPGAYLAWAAYRDDRVQDAVDADAKTKTLAGAVAAAETDQRAQLIGPGAHLIDLAFTYRQEPANNAVGADSHGRLSGIVAYYRKLQPARLVITGEPGAGKSLLALDLLLGLLTHPGRTEADPVPVRVSLASWDTSRSLRDWLADQVHDQFRNQGISPADAQLLVARHRVLPVLDGLDEMDTATTPAARRRAARALDQLNAYQDPTGNAPIILTCRTTQYAELAALDVRMREAARIEIAPVTPAQATAYLTARSTCPARWTSVLDTLTTTPGGTLARALSTPWRLNLATTAYEERRPDTRGYLLDPDHLLTLDSPSAVREHLLDLYVPAAVNQHPTRPGRYRPDQAHRWLATLAAHLATTTPPTTASGGTDLVLHQLWPMAGPRRVRTADVLLAVLLAALLVSTALLLARVLFGFPPHQLSDTLLAALLLGLWAPKQAGHAAVPPPRAAPLHLLRNPAQRRQLADDLTFGVVVGLLVGLTFGLAIGLMVGLTDGLGAGLAVGLAVGLGMLALGPVGMLAQLAELSISDDAPTDPRHPVRDDLAVGLALGLVYGLVTLVIGIVVLVYGLAAGLAGGFAVGLAFGLGIGPVFGMHGTGAGRRYLVFLCCTRGRLPWRLGAFLHWAYEAGLLRISGMAYQFRHRELQDWLTTRPLP